MAAPGTPVPTLITECKSRFESHALNLERQMLDELAEEPLGFYASLAVHSRLTELDEVLPPRAPKPKPSLSPECDLRLQRLQPRPSSGTSGPSCSPHPEDRSQWDDSASDLNASPMDDPFSPIDFAAYEGKPTWRQVAPMPPTPPGLLLLEDGWEPLEPRAGSDSDMEQLGSAGFSDLLASSKSGEAANAPLSAGSATPRLSDFEMMADEADAEGDFTDLDSATFAELVASPTSASDRVAHDPQAHTVARPRPLRACAKMLVRSGLRCQQCFNLMQGGQCTSCEWIRGNP